MDVKQVLYNFTGEATDLNQTLERIRAHVRSLPRKAKIDIKAEVSQALEEVTNLRTLLEGIRDEEIDVKVRARLGELISDLGKAEVLIRSLPDEKNVNINTKTDVDTTVARVRNAIQGIGFDLEKMGGETNKVGRLSSSFAVLGGFAHKASTVLRRIPPMLAGIAVVILSALVPAILALVSAIGGAITAIGALAASLAAAFGPVLALGIALMQRLSTIMKARQAQQQSLTAETRKSANATLRQAQADEQARVAAQAVTDALEGLTDARANYRQAVEDARDAIADANKDEQEALRELTLAHQELRDAVIDAFDEMRRAALDAKQAILDVASAELAVDSAKLGIRRARLELRQFRKEANLGRSSLDGLFQRASDVTIDPKQARKAIGEILKAGDDLSGEQQLRLEELINALKEAKIREKKATIDLKRAQLDENEARRTAADFAKKGIVASDQYRGAVERLRESRINANEATRISNELEAQGIRGSEQVVAATDAIADAEQRVVDAKNRQRLATLQITAAKEDEISQTQKYKEELAKLSDEERRFLELINQIADGLTSGLRPATDAVLSGIADSLEALKPAFAAAQGLFEELGKAWGDVIRQFTQNLLRPDNLQSLLVFFQAAIPLIRIFGSILTSITNIFMNIAQAAMPLLLSLLAQFAIWLDGLATKTENISGLNAALAPMVETLKLIIGIIMQVGSAIVNTFVAASGPINAFLASLLKAIAAFNQWAQSEEGRTQIRQFFERVLPMARSFLGVLFRFAGAFLRGLETFAPFAKVLFDAIAIVIKGFSDVLGVVADVIEFVRKLVDFVTGKHGFGKVFGFISKFILNPFGSVIEYVKTLIGWVKDLIGWIGKIKFPKLPFGIGGKKGVLGIGGVPLLASGGIALGPTLAGIGERGKEAVLPLTRSVLASLGQAIVRATGGMLPATSGRIPAAAAGGGGGTVIHQNHFNIPAPLDAMKSIDPENTAALLQQAWERRGGGLS